MRETLVTGATGFIGHHLVGALCARGDTVRALVLPTEDTAWLEQHHVTVYRGDVCQREELIEPMQGVDTVFHLAAIHGLWRPRQDYYSVNVTGVENVCRAALAAGVKRLIHVSSWAVYGMGLGQPVREDFPLRPGSDLYAATKADADKLVQSYITRDYLPGVIIRPGTVFGPGDWINFGRMADRLRAGRAIIIGSGRNAVPFVYVSDIVDGLLLAASREQAVGRVFNLTNDQPLTQAQLWHAIALEIGAKPPRLHIPYFALYALAFAAERAVKQVHPQRQPLVTRLGVKLFGSDNRHEIDKARRELGYAPRISLREGVHITARWYLQHRNGSQVASAAVA
ncbi:MAG: NAD-dependent epimerase/dehydratase family protein [Acidobacteriia bacterium]|nr:NAD-dependent epimerase/dehydratase family protein [Terriglobia bacterium]